MFNYNIFKKAEEFKATLNEIIMIRGGQVLDFKGKYLNVGIDSSFVLNPNIIESENLKEWLLTFDISNLVDDSVNVVQEVKFNIKTLNLNSVDKNDNYEYFKSKAIILTLNKINSCYMACPIQKCQKKVIELDGKYKCVKCEQSHETFVWKFLMQICICDFTDAIWITCFEAASENILGLSADELNNWKNTVNLIFYNTIYM